MNANTIRKNDMIGAYSVDASYVYYQKVRDIIRD